MKRFFLLSTLSLLLVGCSSTPPTIKTQVLKIEPIGSTSKVVVETNGNFTRIYSTKLGEK